MRNAVNFRFLIFFLLVIFSLPLMTVQAEPQAKDGPVTAQIITEKSSIQPGTPFWIALQFSMDDGFHAYWKNPGENGMPINISWDLPEGFHVEDLHWPYPEKFQIAGLTSFGYNERFILLAKISPPKEINNDAAAISANLRWVSCSGDSCIPGKVAVDMKLPVSIDSPENNSQSIALFSQARSLLPTEKKDVDILKQGRILQIKVPHSDSYNAHTADFFPEQQSYLDHDIAPIVHSKEGETNVTLTLKEGEKNKLLTEPIKGVLVLKNSQETLAFNIEKHLSKNVLSDDDSGMLTMADSLRVGSSNSGYMTADGLQETNIIPDDLMFSIENVLVALAMAFVGGMILNLMPCVLPVISFKILSFVKIAGESRKRVLFHGLAFCLGVLISFWSLAGVLLVLQAYGKSVGWGFQLQEPIFVAALAIVIYVFALSLFGVFEIGTIFASWVGTKGSNVVKKTENLSSSFTGGVLATAVATPCTGPFLGSAVGFAVTLPPVWALLIFTSLGLGMASPYLLLSAFPQLLKFLPKPGNWMVTFKELMGFIMMATVLWLAWVFASQTSSMSTFLLLAGFLLTALGCWIWGKWGMPHLTKRVRIIGAMMALALIGISGNIIFTAANMPSDVYQTNSDVAQKKGSEEPWESFSAERLAQLREQGKPVFVDFTAKWCLICQANHLVVSIDQVAKRFQDLGVVKMKADWTKNDPEITKELKKWGRSGVPLYLLYGNDPKLPPEVLPQVLTPENVLQYLNNLPILK